MAARPNGYMWKVETVQGEVQKTLQFKDEENNKLIFGRLYAFNRYILSINGQNKLLIIDMNDKQQITKVYPNCSQLSFVYDHFNVTSKDEKNDSNEKSFYLFYMENGKNLVIERCSIKNIQRSFEASLSKNFVGQCAELFEKYEALQNIKNLKSILKANLLNPSSHRFQFSSSFKDSVKRIEDDEFRWMREKEIDQKEFKNVICSYQKNNGQLAKEIQTHHKTEGDIVKIVDLESIQKRNNKQKLQIKYVNPKNCVINFSTTSYDIELDNNQNSQNIKNKNKNTTKIKKNKDIEYQNITQIQQQNNTKRNSLKIIPQYNDINNIIPTKTSQITQPLSKLSQEKIEMLKQSIKVCKITKDEFQKDNKTTCNIQYDNQNKDSEIINKYNSIIKRKINEYGRRYLKQDIIRILKERNEDMIEWIQTYLTQKTILFILTLLSRNFIKQFIYSHNKHFSYQFLSDELLTINQIKSTVDILNDKHIYVQIVKQYMLQYFRYFVGDQVFFDLYQAESYIDFDEISDIINNLQNQ